MPSMVEVSTLHNQAKVYRTEGKVTGVELKEMVGDMRIKIGKVRLQLLYLSFQFSLQQLLHAKQAPSKRFKRANFKWAMPSIAKGCHLPNQAKVENGQ